MAKRLAAPIFAMIVAATIFAFSTQAAHADPRDFTLINGSSTYTIVHVFVEPSGPEPFSTPDILGRDVLLPGESVFIYFDRFTPGNCLYDILVVFDDGSESEILNVNLCETDTVTFS